MHCATRKTSCSCANGWPSSACRGPTGHGGRRRPRLTGFLPSTVAGPSASSHAGDMTVRGGGGGVEVVVDGFLAEHGGRAILKQPRGGYDGKGVRIVGSGAEASDW